MIRPVLLLAVVAGSSVTLATDYGAKRVLRIESSNRFQMETVEFEFIRNGERMDSPFGGGGSSSESSRRVVVIERLLESEDGRPKVIEREFETVEGSSTRSFGDQEMETEYECPLDGVTLRLTDDEGDVEVEVIVGDSPDDELLEGHRLELASDALFPEGEIEVGETWDLEAEDIRRLLGLDVMSALFQRPSREGRGGFGGGGGEGRGRGRGGRRGGGIDTLAVAEWTGTAVLERDDDTHVGERCARIEFDLEASGELPEIEFEDFRRRAFGLPALPRENRYEIEAQGHLVFSLETRRPVALEVEGEIGLETGFVREREGMEIEMRTRQEGTFAYEVEVSVEEGP